MTHTLKYLTLDVFTDTPYTGNPLALVSVPPDLTPSLTQDQKQRIAVEFNYSETVFIHPPSADGIRQVDIFTPKSEIPFAGHPTIGAASHVIKDLESGKDEVVLALKAGHISASFEPNSSGLDGITRVEIPHNVRIHARTLPWEKVASVQSQMGSTTAAVGSALQMANAHIVSIVNGMNFALVDLSTKPQLLDQVKVSDADLFGAEDLDDGWEPTLNAALFFIRQPDKGDGIVRIKQRVIAIGLEDPATGSASCALCAFLMLEGSGMEGTKTQKFQLEQGVQMGRRSLISCEVSLTEDRKAVEKIVLAGQTRAVMKGELII